VNKWKQFLNDLGLAAKHTKKQKPTKNHFGIETSRRKSMVLCNGLANTKTTHWWVNPTPHS